MRLECECQVLQTTLDEEAAAEEVSPGDFQHVGVICVLAKNVIVATLANSAIETNSVAPTRAESLLVRSSDGLRASTGAGGGLARPTR
jgi:hypothetical protein